MPSTMHGSFMSYVFPPPTFIPLVLSKFLVEHVTSQPINFIDAVTPDQESPYDDSQYDILTVWSVKPIGNITEGKENHLR